MTKALHKPLSRLAAVPFEALIGVWAAYSGAAGLLNYGVTADVLDSLLGGHLVDAFQVAFLLAGLALLLGLAVGRMNVEAFGLIVIMASVVVRQIALVYVVGFNATIVNALVFNAALLFFAFVRLRTLARGSLLIVVDPSEVGQP